MQRLMECGVDSKRQLPPPPLSVQRPFQDAVRLFIRWYNRTDISLTLVHAGQMMNPDCNWVIPLSNQGKWKRSFVLVAFGRRVRVCGWRCGWRDQAKTCVILCQIFVIMFPRRAKTPTTTKMRRNSHQYFVRTSVSMYSMASSFDESPWEAATFGGKRPVAL